LVERKIEQKVLGLHEKLLSHYSVIRAENFIQNLELLWEASESKSASSRLEEYLQADWLQFSLRMCVDKLPSSLSLDSYQPNPESSWISFALYQVRSLLSVYLFFSFIDIFSLINYI
jgi:hypothetical protein